MTNAEALAHEGFRAQQAGDLARAEALYRQALRLMPDQPQLCELLGSVMGQTGRPADAARLLNAAIEGGHDTAEVHFNLGEARRALREFPAAAAAFRAAITRRPEWAEARYRLAVTLLPLGDEAGAEKALTQAMRLDPRHAEAASALAQIHARGQRHEEAERLFRRVLEIDPRNAEAMTCLASIVGIAGDVDAAIAGHRKALALRGDLGLAWSNLLITLHNEDATTPFELFGLHRKFGVLHDKARPLVRPPRPPGERLRIGYVSPDLHDHSVARFLLPVLRNHDRARVEVFLYSDAMREDSVNAGLRAQADRWVATQTMDDQRLAATIAADGIDVAIDLAGHTPQNRLLTFTLRPAPTQVTWLGYPDTTGLSQMDARITDAIADPPGPSDLMHIEKLIRLPECFLVFKAIDAPDVVARPSDAPVVFGSFNNVQKYSRRTLGLWASILAAVPESRLVLKGMAFANDYVRGRFTERLAKAGIDPARVEPRAPLAKTTDHLAAYGDIDIALDTLPYNGTTTTCEALWMGVPVVTMRGDRHCARVGASLLNAVGLADLVAEDESGYVARAVALAGDHARRAHLRGALRAMMGTSPLCDARRFTAKFEEALIRLARPT
jgi:predicted O-linked N-acetylglucosamine transferase (SPINDLY family)